jgi:tight adherence protein C
MSSTLGTDPPVNSAWTYLAIHIGDARFEPLYTCILVVALTVAMLSVFNLWRIGQREDRGARINALSGSLTRRPGSEQRPSLRWHDRLGPLVAVIGNGRQKKMLSAVAASEIRGHRSLASVIGSKVCVSVAFVAVVWLILERLLSNMESIALDVGIIAGASIIGWHLPEVVLTRLAKRRRIRLERGMPDALDLLVICAEAGLSLDQAIEQVSRDIRPSNREVAQEFAATAAEMRILTDRGQALENLARRAGLSSLRSVIATLNQSIKFGTPLATSLRVLATDMRSERLSRFEERAARLPVLLTVPLMALILPALMIVIGTPLVLRILDTLWSLTASGK